MGVFCLSAAERRFALTSFAVKVAIFWTAQLVACQLDPRRLVCGVVEKGFLPPALPDQLCGDGFCGDSAAEASLGALTHCQGRPTMASADVLAKRG
jgi:hypothetical protein